MLQALDLFLLPKKLSLSGCSKLLWGIWAAVNALSLLPPMCLMLLLNMAALLLTNANLLLFLSGCSKLFRGIWAAVSALVMPPTTAALLLAVNLLDNSQI